MRLLLGSAAAALALGAPWFAYHRLQSIVYQLALAWPTVRPWVERLSGTLGGCVLRNIITRNAQRIFHLSVAFQAIQVCATCNRSKKA